MNALVESVTFMNLEALSDNSKKSIEMVKSLLNKDKNPDTTYIQHEYLDTILRKNIWAQVLR